MKDKNRGRNSDVIRILRLADLLRQRRCSMVSLAETFGVTTRTIRRDIAALEAAYLPVRKMSCDEGVAWSMATSHHATKAQQRAERPPATDAVDPVGEQVTP